MKWNAFLIQFTEEGVPTSVDFVRCDPTQMVASYTSSNTYIFDIETGKQVLMLETKLNSGMRALLQFLDLEYVFLVFD